MITKHPTPAEIRYAIERVLHDDSDANRGDPKNLIPARVIGLIRKGISNACDGVTQ